MNVFIIAAMTADGFIGRDTDHLSTDWTSREDAQFFTKRTKAAGVCVMGAKTFATIGRALPDRKTIVYTRDADSLAQFPDNQVQATTLAPQALITKLTQEGHREIAICGGTSIYTMFWQAGVVNQLYLTIEPVIFGGGVSLFDSSQKGAVSPVTTKLPQVKLVGTTQLSDQTLMLEYQVNHSLEKHAVTGKNQL